MENKPVNRAERRRRERIERMGTRPHGVGYGKHALNGNKFRGTHVNWFKRIVKEMGQNRAVIERVVSGKLDLVLDLK